MKIYVHVATLLLASVLVKCELPQKVLRLLDECEKEVVNTIFSPNTHEQKAKCFHACTSKKHGFMVDGKIVIDKAVDIAMKYESEEIGNNLSTTIPDCAEKANQETEECEVAGAYYKCYMEKIRSY